MPLGVQNLQGTKTQNNILIGTRTSLNGPTYRGTCCECGATFPVLHRRAAYMTCPYSNGHGKTGPAKLDTKAEDCIAAKEVERQRRIEEEKARLDQTEQRMQEALGDEKDRAPRKTLRDVAIPKPMGDRERAEWKKFVAEEAAAVEAKLKPIVEEWKRLNRAIAIEERNAIRDGADNSFIDWFNRESNDERLNVLTMAEYTEEQQREEILMQRDIFLASMPRIDPLNDFLPTDKNIDAVYEYIGRQMNALHLPFVWASAPMLCFAAGRLRRVGLLEEQQHVYIEPEPHKPDYFEREEQRQKEADALAADIASRTDQRSGEVLTKREIDAMPSDVFRKHFPINRSGETLGDLWAEMREQRGNK